jgi:hypothetical protein
MEILRRGYKITMSRGINFALLTSISRISNMLSFQFLCLLCLAGAVFASPKRSSSEACAFKYLVTL